MGGTFSDNDATTGGAVYADRDVSVSGGAVFTGNDAASDGGAIRSDTGSVTIVSSTLGGPNLPADANTAGGGGGAISASENVTLTNATVMGNRTTGLASGGGVSATDDITVTGSTVSGNTSLTGSGGLHAQDEVSVENSTISGNEATNGGGGGITSQNGPVTVTNSTIADNTAGAEDGGISQNDGLLTVTGSTFSGNEAASVGGGLSSVTTGGMITNSTFSDNTAGGGSVHISTGGTVDITNATFEQNDATGGDGGSLSAPGGTITLANSILANAGSTNCDIAGTLVDDGYNILFPGPDSTDGDCPVGDPTDTDEDPELAPLAVNAPGTTATHAIADDSPAFDAIDDDTVCPPPAADQRGITRPQFDFCDIGSYELTPTPPTPVCPAAASASIGPATLAGAEGIVAAAPLGFQFLWRRRRQSRGARQGNTGSDRRARLRATVMWLLIAGLMIAVFVACQPVKETPPC